MSKGLEWLLFGAVALISCWVLLREARRDWRIRGFLFGGIALCAFVAWKRDAASASQGALIISRQGKIPKTGGNPGYVSSDQCAACHPGQYKSWHDSFHRRMTQYATPQSVLGDFKDHDFEVDGHRIRLQRRGGEFWAEMADPDWTHDQARAKAGWPGYTLQDPAQAPRLWKQIGLTTGSHRFQAYWVASKHGNLQFGFPLVWLVEEKRWVPRKDTFIRDPVADSPNQIWNVNCIQCHTTGGIPNRDPKTGLIESMAADLGISCEACHGPGEKHAEANRNPVRRYSQHARSGPASSIINPNVLPPHASTEVCGQCHAMKFIPEIDNYLHSGFTFRPGAELEAATPLLRHPKRHKDARIPEEVTTNAQFMANIFWSDGMIRVTGREYSGLIESACHVSGGMTCLSCHSMHSSQPDDQLAKGMRGNQACLQCHPGIGRELSAHTHHSPQSSGSQCYSCHMPHATYGLLKVVRNHYIDSPSAQSTLETGRPNACNLCHLDKALSWTATNLAAWTRKPMPSLPPEHHDVSLAVLLMLKGDVAQRALIAGNAGNADARKASGENWLALYLSGLLDDPYPAVRYLSFVALRQIPGYEHVEFDFIGLAADRNRVRDGLVSRWKPKPNEVGASHLLLDQKGELVHERIVELLRARDDRLLDLVE